MSCGVDWQVISLVVLYSSTTILLNSGIPCQLNEIGKNTDSTFSPSRILFQASNPQFLKYIGSWFGVVSAVKDIQQNEKAFGLYRGHSVTLLRVFPYAAIKFVAYEQIRAVLITSKQEGMSYRRFTSGSLAGILQSLSHIHWR